MVPGSRTTRLAFVFSRRSGILMVARLTAFEDEEREDDEKRSEGFPVFDVDNRLKILTDEKLAHENQSDVQQRPQCSKSWKRGRDERARGKEKE